MESRSAMGVAPLTPVFGVKDCEYRKRGDNVWVVVGRLGRGRKTLGVIRGKRADYWFPLPFHSPYSPILNPTRSPGNVFGLRAQPLSDLGSTYLYTRTTCGTNPSSPLLSSTYNMDLHLLLDFGMDTHPVDHP